MEIKDVKIGDKVRIRKDISDEELTGLLDKYSLTTGNTLRLQRRGETVVDGIQEGIPGKKGSDWDSITLEDSYFFWPVELFEPVSNTNKKSKEEQVQEDIQKIKDIVKRYGLTEQGGPVMSLIKWLEDFGQDNLVGE